VYERSPDSLARTGLLPGDDFGSRRVLLEGGVHIDGRYDSAAAFDGMSPAEARRFLSG
jgi:hypothetical protein